MLRYSIELTNAEVALVETLRDVAFGEIYGIKVEPGEVKIPYDLSDAERSLIFEIRSDCPNISVLHIHERQPTYAEVDIRISGFSCRKKVKFPTV